MLASLFGGLLAGAVAACFLVYAAWDHNPQQAYHESETGYVDYAALARIGGAGFVVVAAPASATLLFTLFCGNWLVGRLRPTRSRARER
jgi:hypothetical protein